MHRFSLSGYEQGGRNDLSVVHFSDGRQRQRHIEERAVERNDCDARISVNDLQKITDGGNACFSVFNQSASFCENDYRNDQRTVLIFEDLSSVAS
jgi:hypothetical protein